MTSIYESVENEIRELVVQWTPKLQDIPETVLISHRNKQNRTIKQILGHLTDSAVNNHHRIVRLQYNEDLNFPDYRQDNDTWIRIQDFQNENWGDLVTFWKYYNVHLMHVIANIDSACLKNTWKDFEGTVETLDSVVKGYLWHLNLHLKEIEELI